MLNLCSKQYFNIITKINEFSKVEELWIQTIPKENKIHDPKKNHYIRPVIELIVGCINFIPVDHEVTLCPKVRFRNQHPSLDVFYPRHRVVWDLLQDLERHRNWINRNHS